MADMRMMIDDEPRRRSSSDTLHALTVALVKPGRGACWNQARNSARQEGVDNSFGTSQ